MKQYLFSDLGCLLGLFILLNEIFAGPKQNQYVYYSEPKSLPKPSSEYQFNLQDGVTPTGVDTNKCYLISGSFLVPSNADTQVKRLHKLGFNQAYKYNFPQSEFYAVVVDTFNPKDTIIVGLIEKLIQTKQEYFVRCL